MMVKDAELSRVHVHVDPDLLEALDRLAATHEPPVSRAWLVRKILGDYVRKETQRRESQ